METVQVDKNINITSLLEKIRENESLKGKITGLRGNSFDIIVGSKEYVNVIMAIYVNNNVISSFLRLEEYPIMSESESKMCQGKNYQNIFELQQEIERLFKEFKTDN